MAKNNRQEKVYRLLYVDKYAQKPHIDLLVRAYNKPEAEEKGRAQIVSMAIRDLSLITEGAVSLSPDVIKLSPDYFSTLVNGCWVLTECEQQIAVSAHVSKRSADDVKAAAEKSRRANGKKRRWTKAEKAARKARVEGTTLALVA